MTLGQMTLALGNAGLQAPEDIDRRRDYCADPLDAKMARNARYCSRRCKDAGELATRAERDYADRRPAVGRSCRCPRPILLDDGRDLKCGLAVVTVGRHGASGRGWSRP